MAARASVYSLLSDDTQLQGLCGRVYASGGVDTPPEQTFIILRWEPTESQFPAVRSDRLTVWAHDRNPDYSVIDDILQRCRELLESSIHRQGGDGWSMTLAEWEGEGPDAEDGGYNTLTRYAEYTVVSRYGSI